jgi:hypothetical protein
MDAALLAPEGPFSSVVEGVSTSDVPGSQVSKGNCGDPPAFPGRQRTDPTPAATREQRVGVFALLLIMGFRTLGGEEEGRGPRGISVLAGEINWNRQAREVGMDSNELEGCYSGH